MWSILANHFDPQHPCAVILQMQERQEERASIVPLNYTCFSDTDVKAAKQSSVGNFYIASTMIDG